MATVPATPVHSPMVSATGERCPTCGSVVAADQRYCLECGQRQGEPRLPFMDATTFMETSAQRRRPAPPPPPRPRKQRVSPNAALIAGVGTLLLAMGIGVMIGRSGNQTPASTAAAPQIIKVGGGEATTATAATADTGGKAGSKKKSGGGKGGDETGASGQTAAAESVLKPTAAAGKLPPPVVKPGDKGSGRGYNKSGEFDGNFFGE